MPEPAQNEERIKHEIASSCDCTWLTPCNFT